VNRGRFGDERGSATAEFTMISALLLGLCLVVVQIAGMVHVRNTLIDAASTGARFGALHDRTADDGLDRTRELISSSVSGRYAENVTYDYSESAQGRTLRITVRAQYPLLGLFAGVGDLEVSGSAYEFD